MTMTRQEFLDKAGIEVRTLEVWLEQRWLVPDETPAGTVFTEREIARAGLIRDLDRDFGVNQEGIDLILHLMDQLHGLREALALLQTDLRKPRP
jgi:chaperone modulatory protein CbpM